MELFEYLSGNPTYKLDAVMKEYTLPKGYAIYTPGAFTHYIYEIVHGAVKLGSYGHHEQKVTYDVLTAPNTFGNLRYLDGQFFEFAESLMPTKIRAYQRDFFKRIIVEDHFASEWFNKSVVRRWCVAETRLFKVRALDKKENLKSVMNELNVQVVDAHGRQRTLLDELSMQDLGDLTGMTRQTVSTQLKQIETERVKARAI
ncbi:Crp/Fnr family transcriptional regulator [Roseivirga sp.]|uniref:Crp/Fnr family transcriptional regulator n=1 Tax=Roseivirga sp. TaxID=1964215 RepID=UPI003B52CBAF